MPTIKETEQHHLMLPLLIQKGWLVMLLKIKPPRIQLIQSLMPRDWLVGNLLTQLSKKIWNSGHLNLNQELMISQSLSSNIKEKSKNSMLKKFHQWSLLKWDKLLNPSSEKPVKMQLSLSQPISVTIKDKPPKMQGLLLD